MDLFELQAVLRLNSSEYTKGIDDAEKKGTGFIDGLTNAWTRAKSTFQMARSFASPVISIVSEAVDAFGDYEQAVGGVRKLFGDSAKTITDNARKAFQTAQISINDYMELCIMSGATMLKSVGEDSQKAAELMDMAILDMADNVNALGTTMTSVQDAYRGFSRGNWTMLDNLALGYSGTAQGMFELLTEAAELNDEFARTAEFSMDAKGHLDVGYADVVKAIHIIQQYRNITGTSVNEAATTQLGSKAAMEAAKQNMLVVLADSEASQTEKEEAAKAYADALGAYFKNLIPIIKEALKGILTAIKELIKEAPEFISDIANMIADVLTDPSVLAALWDILTAFIEALWKIFTEGPDAMKAVVAAYGIKKGYGVYKWGKNLLGFGGTATGVTGAGGTVTGVTGAGGTVTGVTGAGTTVAGAGTEIVSGVGGTVGGITGAEAAALQAGANPTLFGAGTLGTMLAGGTIAVLSLAAITDALNGSDYQKNADTEATKFDEAQAAIIEAAVADLLRITTEETDENGLIDGEKLFGVFAEMAQAVEDAGGSAEDFVKLFDYIDTEGKSKNFLLDLMGFDMVGSEGGNVADMMFDAIKQIFGEKELDLITLFHGSDSAMRTAWWNAANQHAAKARQDDGSFSARVGYNVGTGFQGADALLSYLWQFGHYTEGTGWTANRSGAAGGYDATKPNYRWFADEGLGAWGTVVTDREGHNATYYYDPEEKKFYNADWTKELGVDDLPEGLANSAEGLGLDFSQAFAEGIENGSGQVALAVFSLIQAAVAAMTGAEVGGGGGAEGSHAKGLLSVPYDDYLANLHRGEMVLTASQAREFRNGGGEGSADVVAAINGMRNDLQHLQLVVGQKAFGQTVVDYSGRRMQGFIGQAEDRTISGYGWG